MSASPTKEIAIVQIGTGVDLHGQDATAAAVRACRDAVSKNSLPGLARLLPGGFEEMKIRVLLGVPPGFVEMIDVAAVKDVFPYGKAEVVCVDGGLLCRSGVVLEDKNDAPGDDRVIVIVASVEVYA